MRYSLPIEPEPPMVTAEEILKKAFNDYYEYITEQDIMRVAYEYDEKTIYREAITAFSDEVFAAIERVKAKHPEGLGRQNACKGFEEEMRKFFGMEEV